MRLRALRFFFTAFVIFRKSLTPRLHDTVLPRRDT